MAACAVLASAVSADAQAPVNAALPTAGVTLPGHVPGLVSVSTLEGPVPATQTVGLALSLPLQNPKGLEDLIHNLYDASSPTHGQYLTPAQFTSQFGPSQADYDALTQWAKSKGLTVTGTNPTRTVLDVSAPASTVQSAFGLHLMRYLDPAGREFFAPDANPTVDASVGGIVSGVLGLDDADPPQPAIRPSSLRPALPGRDFYATLPAARPPALRLLDAGTGLYAAAPDAAPAATGSGPGGGLTPRDIKTAYNLNGVSANGAGQNLGLYELSGVRLEDVWAYENAFGLPNVSIPIVLVGGFDGVPRGGIGQIEATADIELQIALAPTRVFVYESSGTEQNQIDLWCRIASDNLAKQVSTSWYNHEGDASNAQVSFRNVNQSMVTAEDQVFEQMAAQGQTVYAASGDDGAYGAGYQNGLQVIDPASQPFVCGVGGTSLTTNVPGGTRSSEVTWMGTTPGSDNNGGGSGGGISVNWQIPYYQYQPGVYSANTNYTTSGQGGSPINRDVPDVSLNAGPSSPYAIYENGGWLLGNGTSFAAPLWAGFTALVNQQRSSNGLAPLGLVNPYIYQIGRGSRYAADFYDIVQGSNGLQAAQSLPSYPGYAAASGYDAATGWGSFNGLNLFNDLSTIPAPSPVPLPLYIDYNSGRNGYFYNTSLYVSRTQAAYGYNFLNIACRVYGGANDVPGLVPLYECQNPTTSDHFYTISYADLQDAMQNHGYINGGDISCYVFPNGNTPGTVPLYGAFYVPTSQHYVTDDPNFYSAHSSLPNYRTDGIKCYVLP